jgi:hypothetical protein
MINDKNHNNIIIVTTIIGYLYIKHTILVSKVHKSDRNRVER